MTYEFGKALPDQVTTERLEAARRFVATVCEIDPANIEDGVALAQTLQGVSRAVSDIALAKGGVETSDLRVAPGFDPAIMPTITAGNILRRFADPVAELGRMFVAQPSKGFGASMGVHEVTSGGQTTTHDIVIPTDQFIDRLLMQEPCFWNEMSVYSRDFRSGQQEIAYPFNNRYYTEGAAQRYFAVLQELSAELVEA